MMSDMSDDEVEPGVLIQLKDRALRPVYAITSLATSKTAQKTYLNTILAVIAGSILFLIALVAYIIFYYSYVPARGFSKPIYLQFEGQRAPYGSASIAGALVSYQHYDVKVTLHMPRTASNKAAGNFMVDLQLHRPGSVVDNVLDTTTPVLAHSSRPAILKYHSITMEQVHRAAALPLHLIGWRDEAETLKISMFEGVEFAKGWRNIPDSVHLELRSEERLQVYDVSVEFIAQLRGLRYMMYNFRLTSLVILTSTFWTIEVLFALVVWTTMSFYVNAGPSKLDQIKAERKGPAKQEIKDEDTMSDTPHTFPTLSGQPPLQYAGPGIKHEEEELPVEIQPRLGEQADDEDEDADFVRDELSGRGFTDSGIGTSMESSGGRPSAVRRRISRGLRE